MGTSRTRSRSGDACGLSPNTSPTRSPSIYPPSRPDSEDREDIMKRKSMRTSADVQPAKARRGRKTPSIEREDGFGLWTEPEINAIIDEVLSKKTADTAKFFSGSSGEPLPAALKNRTWAELKAFLDRLKSSFDTSVGSFVPKSGVQELVSVLASEAYFVRTTWAQLPKLCEQLDKSKDEYNSLSKQCQAHTLSTKRLTEQAAVEVKRRQAAESCKGVGEEAANGVKKDIEECMEDQSRLETELNNWRLNELEARRRLDRIRLKVAALRGQMITTTVDELFRPPPKWMTVDVGESVSSDGSDESKVEGERVGKNSNRSSGFSSINGDTAKNSVDKDGDAAMEVEESNTAETEEKPESVDVQIAFSETQAEEEEAVEDEETVEDDTDTGFDEDEISTELRLLKYRLDMYDCEAEEWRSSAAAERVKIAMVTKAKSRLEDELIRYRAQRVGNTNDRRTNSARAKARRAVQAHVELPPVERIEKKNRKGRVRRSLNKSG